MGERKRPEWVDEAIKLYVEEKLSLSQAAERVGKSYDAVRRRLLKSGVSPRSKREAQLLRYRSYREARGLGKFEATSSTTLLLGHNVGDGSISNHQRLAQVYYNTGSELLRDYIIAQLAELGLTGKARRIRRVWRVTVVDVRWWEFNQRARSDSEFLRSCVLQYPKDFICGFFSAEGTHYIDDRGHVVLALSNTDRELLHLVQECCDTLQIPIELYGPTVKRAGLKRRDGQSTVEYKLVLFGCGKKPNLEKALFATTSFLINKRVPSNYLHRRHLLRPEVQEIYDRTLEELYATYGKELVDRELLPAKRTKRV